MPPSSPSASLPVPPDSPFPQTPPATVPAPLHSHLLYPPTHPPPASYSLPSRGPGAQR
ncbi:hypothetical protein BDD12DRAFT_861784 [Trichophaea hybrida]|nr:hypothetical protein BDD12DRAFT_861784 [Trichophaea hybrida]